MKVAVLTSVFPRWKGDFFGNYIYHQAQRHVATGAEVRVVAPHTAGAETREVMDGVRVDRFRYGVPASTQQIAYGGGVLTELEQGLLPKLLLPLFVLGFIVRSIGPVRWADVVHAHWTLAGIIGVTLARLFRKQSVLTVYGVEVFTGRFSFLTKLCISWADHVICISTATEQQMRRRFGDEVAKDSSVIPFGASDEFLAEQSDSLNVRERHGISADDVIVLTVGRLIERKGVEYLFRAVPKLDGNVHLLVVGDGPDRSRLERIAKQLDVENSVTFVGAASNEDLPAYYASCDIFAHPVVTAASGDVEGLGIVLLEAMAKSKPAVASGIGGITDVVSDGETGYLVPEKDPDALAERISALANDRELRERMGDAGRRRVEEHFSVAGRADDVMRVYERLVS